MTTTREGSPEPVVRILSPPYSRRQPAAVALGRAAGAAGAALRVGDLRRRGHHARPHQRGDPDHHRAGAAERGGAPDLRRREPRGDAGGGARLCAAWGCGGSWRCAATRPRARPRFVPHPDGFASGAELVAGLREVGDFEIAVGGLSGGASRGGERRGGHREPQAQARRRRQHGDDAVLLRQRGLPALPRRLRGGGDHGADPSRASCRWRTSPRW